MKTKKYFDVAYERVSKTGRVIEEGFERYECSSEEEAEELFKKQYGEYRPFESGYDIVVILEAAV